MPIELTAIAPESFLLAEPEQGAKAEFDRFALGFQAGNPQRILHQLVVDHDNRTHDAHPFYRFCKVKAQF